MTTDSKETVYALAKIQGGAKRAYTGLTTVQQGDVIQFLINNPSQILITPSDVVGAWLCWNGIMGCTEDIISVVTNATEILG